MLKVVLINPPTFRMIKPCVPGIVNDPESSGHYPPVGLLYIAAMAETVPGCEVRVLDAAAEHLDYARIESYLRHEAPDIVGIQAMTYTLIDSLETARTAKKVNPRVHVCIGGPHVSIYPEETLAFPEVDSVAIGEGEYIFADLLKAVLAGADLSGVTGLMYKKDGKALSAGPRGFIENIDALPFPARHLLPLERYWSILFRSRSVTTMISSRGCPYQCIFCERPHLGKKFRFRSAENVVGELSRAVESGIKGFVFYDDTFTVNRQRVYDICDGILEKKLDIDWSIRARVDTVDEKMLKKLRTAGCRTINFGVESGNPEILKVLRKDIDLKQVQNAFLWCKRLGIRTLGYFMLGNPQESRQQVLETIDFAKRLNPDYINVSLTTPFPGTDLYQMGMDRGLFASDYWKEFARHPDVNFIPRLWEERMSERELRDLLGYAYKNFYARPSIVLKQLLAVKSFRELSRKCRMGIRLLFK
ncbi:MAG: radical SAM protein [Candidatus Omnitrophota bacterium]